MGLPVALALERERLHTLRATGKLGQALDLGLGVLLGSLEALPQGGVGLVLLGEDVQQRVGTGSLGRGLGIETLGALGRTVDEHVGRQGGKPLAHALALCAEFGRATLQ